MPRPSCVVVAVAIVAAMLSARTAVAQAACPAASLPAYSHNDYERKRPLEEALARGFRGIEVDLFLIDGVLRVGHSRGRAQEAPAFEALYLAPLRAVVARCGVLTSDGRPFFVAIELKEISPAAYDTLLSLLRSYGELFAGGTRAPPIETVLVGWYPTEGVSDSGRDSLLRVQYRLRGARMALPNDPERRIRLVSVDYRKTIGQWWRPSSSKSRAIAALSTVKRNAPTRLLRVHNVPADSALYAMLLAAGVDLIGTTRLAETQRLLARLTAQSQRAKALF